eukprot:COSAG06_NODE_1532_length_9160_cov_24.454254_2_plen_175_part_00
MVLVHSSSSLSSSSHHAQHRITCAIALSTSNRYATPQLAGSMSHCARNTSPHTHWRPAIVTSAGQQLVCCAGLSSLGLGQALAGACGRQLHRAALNVFLFIQREEPPPAAPRSHRQSCPSGRCHYGTFHYPQLSCLSASSRQSLTPSTLAQAGATVRYHTLWGILPWQCQDASH